MSEDTKVDYSLWPRKTFDELADRTAISDEEFLDQWKDDACYEELRSFLGNAQTTSFGADIGTTNSLIAGYRQGVLRCFEDPDFGKVNVPSIVARYNGEWIVGHTVEGVKDQIPAENVIRSPKKGRARFANEKQEDAKSLISFYDPVKVVFLENRMYFAIEGTLYSPELMELMILKELLKTAMRRCKQVIRRATFGTPARWTFRARKATAKLGEVLGITVSKVIAESSAVCLHYLHNEIAEGRMKVSDTVNLLSFDLGGGTFDTSLMTFSNGNIKVIGAGGIGVLGGENIDEAFMLSQLDAIQEQGCDLLGSPDKKLWSNMRDLFRGAKEMLTVREKAIIKGVRFIVDEKTGQVRDFNLEVTRQEFEKVAVRYFDSMLRAGRSLLDSMKAKHGNAIVDGLGVILAGGSSKSPLMMKMTKTTVKEGTFYSLHEPDQGIALGCGLQQASADGKLQWKFDAGQSLDANVSGESSLTDLGAIRDVVPLTLGYAVPIIRPVRNIPENLLPGLQKRLYPTWNKNKPYPDIICRRHEVYPIVLENDEVGKTYTKDLTSAAKTLTTGGLDCAITQGNSHLVRECTVLGVVKINIKGVEGKDILVKTHLFYGDKNIKITTECPKAVPPVQEVFIDFSQGEKFTYMDKDILVDETYLNNSLLKRCEAVEYSELDLADSIDLTDVEEEKMDSFFKDLYTDTPKVALEQSEVSKVISDYSQFKQAEATKTAVSPVLKFPISVSPSSPEPYIADSSSSPLRDLRLKRKAEELKELNASLLKSTKGEKSSCEETREDKDKDSAEEYKGGEEKEPPAHEESVQVEPSLDKEPEKKSSSILIEPAEENQKGKTSADKKAKSIEKPKPKKETRKKKEKDLLHSDVKYDK